MILKKLLPLLFLTILFFGFKSVNANTSVSGIQTMGIIIVNDEAAATALNTRLRGTGTPVFIINNIGRGVSQGDIIRFSDKAIYIDEQVWQTLQSDGVLNRLQSPSVITLRARKNGDVWKSRSNVIKDNSEKKGYLLGGEILKIFEDYFGSSPSSGEIVVAFEGNSMSLVAPESFLNSLDYSRVRRITPVSTPVIITNPPSQRYFMKNPFFWQVWAVDPNNPSSDIRYSIVGQLHEGLEWNAQRHAIEGEPVEGGIKELAIVATNPSNRTDTLFFNLNIRKNSPPQIYSVYPKEVAAGSDVSFKFSVSDFDHTLEEIEVEAEYDNVEGLEFMKDSLEFIWSVPDTIDSAMVSFSAVAWDLANDTTVKDFNIAVLSAERLLKRKAIKFNLPVDTLTQLHTYVWLDTLWETPGVEVIEIIGSDSTLYKKNSKADIGNLVITPLTSGLHTLVFKVMVENLEVSIVRNIPVKKNRSPVFKTMLSAQKIPQGYPLFYKPYAKDHENDTVTITTNDTSLSNIKSINGETVFKLNTDESGIHFIEFKAQDNFGNSSHQLVSYEVERKESLRREVAISNLYSTNWDLSYTSGWWKIGLFSTHPLNFIKSGNLGNIDAPMIYVGVNFFNKLTTKRDEDFFFFDAGINLRNRGPRIIGGGILARADMKYSPGEKSNWSFETRAQFAAKQIILIVDTTNVTTQELEAIKENILNSSPDELDPETNLFDLFSQGYPPLRQLLDEYSDEKNAVLYVEASTLYNVGRGFSLGPAALMEFFVNSKDVYRQHTGVKIKHSFGISRYNLENNIITGYNPKNNSIRMFWGFKAAFGVGK